VLSSAAALLDSLLSILRECAPVVMQVRIIEVLASLNRIFSILPVPLVLPVVRMRTISSSCRMLNVRSREFPVKTQT
jgi:hypothetical protein